MNTTPNPSAGLTFPAQRRLSKGHWLAVLGGVLALAVLVGFIAHQNHQKDLDHARGSAEFYCASIGAGPIYSSEFENCVEANIDQFVGD